MSPLTQTQIAQIRMQAEAQMGDTVTLETYQSQGAFGSIYAAAIEVTCHAINEIKLVRDANGREAISTLQVIVAGTDVGMFLPDSRVTFAGRTTYVMSSLPQNFHGDVISAEVTCL